MGEQYARVVVDVAPAHLDRPFDYAVPEGVRVRVGYQVRVSFSGRRRTGWVVDITGEPEADKQKIRPLLGVGGATTWFTAGDLRFYRWVADRYAGTLADVLRHALAARVARVEAEAAAWPEARTWSTKALHPPGPTPAWRPYAASRLLQAASRGGREAFFWRPLPGDDAAAMAADLVERTFASGRSALVLTPDPSSALARVALARAGSDGVDLRGDASPAERYRSFLRGQSGHVRLVVGERSAVFAPLRDLGLVIVDDEANPAYKERRSPRYHAREVALARARLARATCVLVGDLPSAAAWRHVREDLVQLVQADRTTQRARLPRVDVVDRSDPRSGAHRGRFSDRTAQALTEAIAAGGAAVVLAARRGQGAVLGCQGCGKRLSCPVCTGSIGPSGEGWACGACGWTGPAEPCSLCGDERTTPLAAGVGRLAQELSRSYPRAQVVRMEGFDAPGPTTRPAIAVMTRGSVVTRPGWLNGARADLVVIVDADAMLRRGALDAGEDALRLWLTVARWTRHVVVQTREPGHPAIQALVRGDPDGFWEREAERRAELRYPPAGWLVRITCPADDGEPVASQLRDQLPETDEVLGPSTEGAVLVKSAALRGTLAALTPLRHAWGSQGRKIRVDVDPATTDRE